MKLFFLISALAISFSSSRLQPKPWKLSEAYIITFSSSKVNGSFRGLKASILFDENNLAASKISASIAANTIDTGIGLRDKHAKSESGLNAEKSPEISFTSTRIIKTGTGYEATGKLSLKDVSKEIKLPFTFEKSGTTGLFKGKFTITPQDYNVTRFGTPDRIEIQLTIPVTN